jgi:hypothetical protein
MALAGSPFGQEWVLTGRVGDGGSRGLAALAIGDRSGVVTRAGASNLVWHYQPGPFNLIHNTTGIDPTTPVGFFPSACLDSNGQPAISYHNDLNLGTGSLRFVGANDAFSSNWRGPVLVNGSRCGILDCDCQRQPGHCLP